MVKTGLAEQCRLAGIEIGGDDEQTAPQFPEIVGPAAARVEPAQVALKWRAVKEARGHRRGERRQQFRDALRQRCAQELTCGAPDDAWQTGNPARVFANVGLQEQAGMRGFVAAIIADGDPADVDGCQAICEAGREHRA